ncbi:MAG: FAD-dependent oxidoreductase [Leptospiraceae bacterium]|nr:FAD-dependent oxidoreductase [Leptospiraceae bacterium]
MKEKLGIIGTGVAAMSAGHFLQHRFDIELFDKADYIGGHSNTVLVEEDGVKVPIDTGFIVYNDVTYPNLKRLFHELKVPVKNSDMSFSVQHLPSGLEFCGSGINGLFAQRRNFFNPKYYRLLYNINRFNQEAPNILDKEEYSKFTLKDYIQKFKFHNDLLEYYLIPMSSAVWSTPINKMLSFPIVTLVRFFYNHGFLGLNTQHQWKTVDGGSKSYVEIITKPFKNKIYLKNGAKSVERKKDKVEVLFEDGSVKQFDKVILATHADTSFSLIKNPSEDEKNILSHFHYESNVATLHTDDSIMPKKKLAWSAWNYRVEQKSNGTWLDSNLIYWMNALQGVSKKRNYFVSINDSGNLDPTKIILKVRYEHPLYTPESIQAQNELQRLNTSSNLFFCGSYFKYGFHEDAFTSGLNLARTILREKIWE